MLHKLVTFDVTNTLLKFRVPLGEQYANVGRLYGAPNPDPIHLSASFRHHWKSLNAEQPNFGSGTSTTASSWWRNLVSRTFESSNCRLDPDQLFRISDHLFALYSTSACWDVRSGTREVLTELRRNRERRLGVISNFDHRLHDVLADTGLLSFFHFVVASRDVNLCKPQTEIFELALERYRVVGGAICRPDQALHVGDDLTLDYLAARKAGWHALLLRQEAGIGDVTGGGEMVDPADVIGDIEDVLARS